MNYTTVILPTVQRFRLSNF